MLGDPLDHPTLACCVAALHDYDHPLALFAHPLLHAHQLLLEAEEGFVVLVVVSHGLILHHRGTPATIIGAA